MQIALLADRLRVEERMLTESFRDRGHDARLLPPSCVHIELGEPVTVRFALDDRAVQLGDHHPRLVLNRGHATAERTALAALMASGGATVVNRPATGRLLSDRLALLRHLSVGQIPAPDTIVCFGEAAIFAAIDQLGYPVLLKSLSVDPEFPFAFVEDRDGAEAMVEHRTILGGEQAVLVQRYVRGRGDSLRAVVVGREVVGLESRRVDGWRPGQGTAYAPYEGDPAPLISLANRVIERLGSGVYAIEIVDMAGDAVVVGTENLVDFRSLPERGIDVAGAIADFALSQLAGASEHREED